MAFVLRGIWIVPLIGLAGVIAACSRGDTVRCEGGTLYREAQTVGQLRVPDDLSVPDETDALRVPGPTPQEEPPASTTCLELSPAYSLEDEESDD